MIFVDSCESTRRENFQQILRLMKNENTPFEDATFVQMESPFQSRGSNDCSVFMLGAFFAWLTRRDQATSHLLLQGIDAKDYGRRMRSHVFDSILDKSVDFENGAAKAMVFNLAENN